MTIIDEITKLRKKLKKMGPFGTPFHRGGWRSDDFDLGEVHRAEPFVQHRKELVGVVGLAARVGEQDTVGADASALQLDDGCGAVDAQSAGDN